MEWQSKLSIFLYFHQNPGTVVRLGGWPELFVFFLEIIYFYQKNIIMYVIFHQKLIKAIKIKKPERSVDRSSPNEFLRSVNAFEIVFFSNIFWSSFYLKWVLNLESV